jgi:hypothetical protein
MSNAFLTIYRSLPRWARVTTAFAILLSAIPAIVYSWIVIISAVMNKYDIVDFTHKNCITKDDFLKYHEASKAYYEALTLYSGNLLRDKMSFTELQLDIVVKEITEATDEYINAKYTPIIAIEAKTDIANAMYIFKSEMKAIARSDYKTIDIDIFNNSEVERYCDDKSETGFQKGKSSITDHYSNSSVPFSELAPIIKPHCPMIKSRIYDSYKNGIDLQKDRFMQIETLRVRYEKSIPLKR